MADDEKLGKLGSKKAQVIEDRKKQIQDRKNAQKRLTENRKKFLAGSFALSEAEKNEDYRKFLYEGLGRFLTREEDRALFDLPTVAEKKPEKENNI